MYIYNKLKKDFIDNCYLLMTCSKKHFISISLREFTSFTRLLFCENVYTIFRALITSVIVRSSSTTSSSSSWVVSLLFLPSVPHLYSFLLSLHFDRQRPIILTLQETDWLEGWHHWVDQNPHHLKDFCESLNVCNNSQMLILSQLPKTFIWRFKSVSSSMIRLKKVFVRRLLYPDVRLLYPIDFYLMTEREPRNRLL